MAVIATASNPRFTVSRVDIDRPGPTYTVDTLTDLRAQRGPDVRAVLHHRCRRAGPDPDLEGRRRAVRPRPLHRRDPARATRCPATGCPPTGSACSRCPRWRSPRPTAGSGSVAATRSGTSCPDGVVQYVAKHRLYPRQPAPGGPMSSGRHRRPEADPLPDVDLAERLAAGQSGTGPGPPRPRRPARIADGPGPAPAGASPLRCRRRLRRRAACRAGGRRGRARADGHRPPQPRRQRSARRRAQRQRIWWSPAGSSASSWSPSASGCCCAGDGERHSRRGQAPDAAHDSGAADRGRRHRRRPAPSSVPRPPTTARRRAGPVPADRRRGGLRRLPFGETMTLGDPRPPPPR